MEEEISKKNQNIKNLEDKHSKEFKQKTFWMEKFLKSIAKFSEAQNYSLQIIPNLIFCAKIIQLNLTSTQQYLL